jgi:hypothetical protein
LDGKTKKKRQTMENEPKKKLNKIPVIVVSVILIIALTLVLVLLPGGKEKSTEEDIEDSSSDVQITTQDTEEMSASGEGTGSDTESPEQNSEVNITEAVTEKNTETGTNSGMNKTEEATEIVTEAPVIDGAGEHKGKLGSVYTIPEGFNDVSPQNTEQGYYYFYEHPEYGMSVQISEFHEENLPVSFEMQYNVYHNLYKNDTSTRVVSDEATETAYTIEAYTDDGIDYFYLKGMKMLDRNVVQIRIQYPAGGNETACRTLLFEILDSYSYQFVSNPDQKTEKATEEITEEGMVYFDETQ